MRNRTRKRSRLKADIAPIHVHELLSGAGMRGFLSVLGAPAPVPHLRQLGEDGGGALPEPSSAPDARLMRWFTAQAELLHSHLGYQQAALTAIAEVARRVNRGAALLHRKAEAAKHTWSGQLEDGGPFFRKGSNR